MEMHKRGTRRIKLSGKREHNNISMAGKSLKEFEINKMTSVLRVLSLLSKEKPTQK